MKSVTQVAEELSKRMDENGDKIKISARRIRALCEAGRIEGATKSGTYWTIPDKIVILEAPRSKYFSSQKKIKMRKVKK